MSRSWDDGVRWHLEQVTAPDWAEDTLAVAFVRDAHLRCASTDEDAYIARLLKTTYRAAERTTRRAHLPQTWALVLDRFPTEIVVPKPPFQAVSSFTYVDLDGVEQTLVGSPATYQVVAPSGPFAGKARIRPLVDTSWPSTRGVMEAVRLEFTCGYPRAGSPSVVAVPEDLDHGRLLMIAELYKQRSESVPAVLTPALIRATDLWMDYRAY